MKNSTIDTKLQTTLSKFTLSHLERIGSGVIVINEIYNKMLQGEIDNLILIGFKFCYLERDMSFDILTEIIEMEVLSDIDKKSIPIVPCLKNSRVKNPQSYLLSLNKQYPMITKAFICSDGKDPFFVRLITNSFGRKMFVTGSYISLDA